MVKQQSAKDPARLNRLSSGWRVWRALFIVLAIAIMLATISPAAEAFGIKPAKKVVNFFPQLSFTDQFVIVRDSDKIAEAKILLEGDLAPYIRLDQEKIILEGTETSIRYYVNLPATLPPGDHVGKIIVEQGLPVNGGRIGARVRITFKIHTSVDYPDKHITASIDIQTANEEVIVTTTIQNLGQLSIDSVQPLVSIRRGETHIASAESAGKPLASGGTTTFVSRIPVDLIPGQYSAIAQITYDGNVLEIIKDFDVGSPTIDILYRDKFLKAGEINTFNLELENKWNAPITGVVASLRVTSEGRNVAELRTETFQFASLETRQVTTYLDARNLQPGTYDAALSIDYPGGKTEESFPLEFLKVEEYQQRVLEAEAPTQESTSLLPIVGLIALLVFNLLVITFILLKLLRKRQGP